MRTITIALPDQPLGDVEMTDDELTEEIRMLAANTKIGGKDASATLSMTKRRTCVTSGINFKTASYRILF